MVPLSALAQMENSEASMTGRGDEDCQGAAQLMTGFGFDSTATFAGQPPFTSPWQFVSPNAHPDVSLASISCEDLSAPRRAA